MEISIPIVSESASLVCFCLAMIWSTVVETAPEFTAFYGLPICQSQHTMYFSITGPKSLFILYSPAIIMVFE